MTNELEKLESLRARMSWAIISSVARGEPIDSTVQRLFDMVTLWHVERVKIQKAEAKRKRNEKA